ncbi:acyl-CoA thioesterase [Teredinibacter purpureus]|uniref:acyl-CoA thioesterase n=1 Tax=Teredinibacter purpureus TaxID=2731756 RepID=UPI001F273AA8|nr:acyl-CoA thioesterase II [Teredinibacter purpureus]
MQIIEGFFMQSYLEQILDLEKLDSNLFRNRHHQENFKGTLFGGQVLSQALLACHGTQDDPRGPTLPHSLHAYFLRAGKSDAPVIYDVEKVRDGRSVISRRVVARQFGRPIFNMSASFHYPEEGFHHQTTFPVGIPMPEALLEQRSPPSSEDPLPAPDKGHATTNPFHLLPVDDDLFTSTKVRPAEAYFWIKTREQLSLDKIGHCAVLAFASDLGLLATALLPHGTSIISPDIFPASVDHAMWFHSMDFRADEWLLCHSYSPWAGAGRGFAHSSLFTKEGQLILTTAQEGLIRQV